MECQKVTRTAHLYAGSVTSTLTHTWNRISSWNVARNVRKPFWEDQHGKIHRWKANIRLMDKTWSQCRLLNMYYIQRCSTSHKRTGIKVRLWVRTFQYTYFFQPHCGLGVYSSLWWKWVPGIFLGSNVRPARKADNLTTICEPIV
jgi:hypothetical protein